MNVLNKIEKKLKKAGFNNIICKEENGAIALDGELHSWEDIVTAGFIAVNDNFRGVINRIQWAGHNGEEPQKPDFNDTTLENSEYDVTIIGAGVIGCSIARELSRYKLKILLLDKEEDVAKHASSRNDGMIHPGFAPKPGSKKAEYNVRGNALYDEIASDLNVDFKRPGSLLLFRSPFSKLTWPLIKQRAKQNKVKGIQRLSRREVFNLEANVTREQHGAVLFPSAGVISPYQLTIALAENSVRNGADLSLNTAVTNFTITNNTITKLHTNRGTFKSRVVINAAGVWADYIADLAGDRFFTIHPRKGMDIILDKKNESTQEHIMALVQLTGGDKNTKGGGIIPTNEGNLLIGPTAEEVFSREDYSTTGDQLTSLIPKMHANASITEKDIITYFSGIRAATYKEDFIIEKSKKVKNLIYAAGIQSPGLASAPAISKDIAEMTVNLLKNEINVEINNSFDPKQEAIPRLADLDNKEKEALIKKDKNYGRIICRCEEVSEAEIRNAINRLVPATTLDAVKRRTRAGMGRCHGGFCTPHILKILSEELGVPVSEITKKGHGSKLIIERTKEQK